ncbi:type II secretion system F family protein [Marinomonas sp. IMCC 4694]|uniref:type II secretion system F family protein n=1 Tax=Marinomonas sp. IMCC 4694 TaxID=2605432 RepID=UPI0011E89D8F|nr:type II secretion system F family protein [Marinomonas sp. IMCC 4694]TYL47918.1 secretion system protein [Marinomonas sp. IMCC 4694]
MAWYKIKHNDGKIDFRYSLSEDEIFFDYLRLGQWHFTISEWNPKKLGYKSLQTFFEEVQSALTSGLQLNQALSHLSASSTHKTLSDTSKAIVSELNKGIPLNDILIRLTHPYAAPYCQLLNSHGTREDCEKSLNLSINQLTSLIDWSQRLLKSLIYPFCIMQIALIILMGNRAIQTQSLQDEPFDFFVYLGIYIFFTLSQLIIIRNLYQGQACHWLESYSTNFRLTKLFSLLSTTRQTGVTLQDAIKMMPNYFQHPSTKQEILAVYYMLRLGKNYASSFPKHWFPAESAIALHSAEQDGDLERALVLATQTHEKRWRKNILLLEKLIPALCLIVAGGIVASALLTLYSPLINLP